MATGISQSALSKFETGAAIPNGEILIVLSKYYKVNIDFLLDQTDETKMWPPKKRKE